MQAPPHLSLPSHANRLVLAAGQLGAWLSNLHRAWLRLLRLAAPGVIWAHCHALQGAARDAYADGRLQAGWEVMLQMRSEVQLVSDLACFKGKS